MRRSSNKWRLAASLIASLAACLAATTASAAAALHECRIDGIRNGVLCGELRRPLDPARPEGVTIDVHYVVVPALARHKQSDPVFLLAGGPGQSAIAIAPQVLRLLSRLNNRRDIVFVDQRGTGRSAPLTCDDPTREPLAAQADAEYQVQSLMSCKTQLQKKPYGDLRFFTTPLAMQDLDAVRLALGAERINLIGASYGTRAALEYQRQFPQAVRRNVIDGVAPADMALPASFSTDGQAALDALLRACTRDAACHAAYPALHDEWEALLKSLPKPVTAAHPLTGAPERFVLTRSMLLDAVRQPLYTPASASALPAAIDAAAHGRYEGLLGLNAMSASRPATQPAMGMHFSVVCAEDLPRMAASRDVAGADFGADSARLYEQVCAGWPRGSVPPGFYDIPTSASPVLLFSGGLDPATPPRHAARVAGALGALARQIVVPNAGHGVMGIGCARDVIYRFIDATDDRDALAVDASCLQELPRPAAFLPIAVPTAPPAEASR